MEKKFKESALRCKQKLIELDQQKRRTIHLPNAVLTVKRGGRTIRVAPYPTPLEEQPKMQEAQQPPTPVKITPPTHMRDQILCRYPNVPKGHTIHEYDLDCVQEGRYINDTIINFVLAWVHGEALGEYKEKVRICDTHWFTRLTRGGREETNVRANLEETRRWFLPTRNPLDKPVTMIPICEDHHWLAVVIVQREGEVSAMIMDSLPSPRATKIRETMSTVMRLLRPDDHISWYEISVVRQGNMVDCGIHLINNATRFLQHLASGTYQDIIEIEEKLLTEDPIKRDDIITLVDTICQGLAAPTIFRGDPLTELLKDLELSASGDEMRVEEENSPAEEDEPCLEIPSQQEKVDGTLTWINRTDQPWWVGTKARSWAQEKVEEALKDMVQKGQRSRCFMHRHEANKIQFRLKDNQPNRVILR